MTKSLKSIGKYQVRSILGEGAMGVVYQAFDPDIERVVAIKMLHDHLQNTDEGTAYRERFRREAQAAARCFHPNIVAVFDLGQETGRDFIVMEFVQGEELRFFLRNGHEFTLGESLHITSQVVQGLVAAHRQGVVHRDIKPANIILLDDGEVKVADFGVARIERSDLTVSGNMVGTPSYMSPEGLQGRKVDHRADIYSTGMVLFEMLTGEKPAPQELYTRPVSAFIDSVFARERGARLPDGVQTLLRRALADDRDNRFADANELLTALRAESAELTASGSVAEMLAETVVAAKPLLPPGPQGLDIPGDVLEELEKGLTSLIGPLAKVLVKKESTSSQTPQAFVESLAAHIQNSGERAAFLSRARHCIAAGCSGDISRSSSAGLTQATVADVISPDQVRKVTEILAFYVGPLALQLVKKRARESSSMSEFHQVLADNIPNDRERAEFLKRVEG